MIDRAQIEAAIDALIGILDEIDGDENIEEDNEDRCGAYDDDTQGQWIFCFGPGDADDAEHDHRWLARA